MAGFAPLFDSVTGRASAWKATNNAAHVVTENVTGRFRESFETYAPNTGGRWVESKASSDLVFVDGNAAAASYLVISKDPHAANTETLIELDPSLYFDMPTEIAFGASMSQRTLGQEFSVEVVDSGLPLPDVSELEIASIVQATTTLTVTTALSHGLSVGKSIGLRSLVDSRINYPALVVASVPAPNQFTVTAGPGGTIASQSAYTASVLAATTAALPAATYANGTLGVGATLTANANGAFPDQDGVAIPLNGRVLVKNEAAPANNGIYTLTTVGSAGAPWVLTRAVDFDVVAEMTVVANALHAVSVYVTGGATLARRQFYLSATVTTVGTTAVTFVDSGAVLNGLGYVYFRERLGRAQNGVSQIFENSTATNASLYIRSESGDALPSGTIAGNHATTVGTTAPVQLINSLFTYAFAPSTEFRLLLQSDRVQWADSGVDAITQTTSRLVRTQVCPDPSNEYKLRVRATNNKALTVPSAQIVSAVKTGTTTATIVTDVPHGLIAGDLALVYGIRAQGATEFPNLTTATPVASVVDANTFTIVQGTAGTVTSYGGYVAKVNGGNLMSALGGNAVVAQSAVLSTLADGSRQLVLTGNASWAGVLVGDLVNAIGVRIDGTGVSLNVDGPWKVANVATTALTLVLPFADQRVLPADFASINCGGAIIKRTDLRLSFVRVFDYARLRVESLARPANDMAQAAPVVMQGGTLPAVTTVSTVSTVTTVSALNGGGAAEDAVAGTAPVMVGGVVRAAVPPITFVAGDAVRDTMTTSGAKTVKPYSVPEADWSYVGAAAVANTTDVVLAVAAGASLRRYITAMQVKGTNAVATEIVLKDGATVIWRGHVSASMENGDSIEFPSPLKTTANAALNFACITTAAAVYVNAQGYTAP